MAEIKPFKGLLYDRGRVDIAKVITPPYDVISTQMQNRFYQRDAHNIIRLILGKDEKGDTARRNKYTRARSLLARWQKEGILRKDSGNVFYIYTQEYLYKGKKRTRIGFIALMKIEDPKESGVLPHEYTLDKPKEDRLRLIDKTEANLSPIFSLFHDRENRINRILKHYAGSREPLFSIEAEGVVHKLWRLDKKGPIGEIRRLMRGKKIFIADGHHRYEVSLAYRNRMRHTSRFTGAMNHIMMYFSSLSERGNLTILSTHRVLKGIEAFHEKTVRGKLARYFRIEKMKDVREIVERLENRARGTRNIGIYTGKGVFSLLTLKSAFPVNKLIESKKTTLLKKLDVTILHEHIIGRVLGVKDTEAAIKYVRNERDAIRLVDKGDYQIAFFLRPTDVMEMKAVAEKGEMMPQKSTYFYPKLLTGLVINKF